jgi:glycerol-3-phosphate acyltransferase PlsX
LKIALDAMGGDLAPAAIVEGAVLAARDFGIEVILTGDGETIAAELRKHDTANLPVRIEHAPESVLMDDSPLEAVLTKSKSSIHVGLDLVKRGDADAFVCAGNSGAVMTASMLILGTLPLVDRPAIASLVPTAEGMALLVDAGANTEVKPINLVQFAIMGSVYWRHVRNVSRPRVGILSNGEESSKGTEVTRAAAEMLRNMPTYVNYIGYVEGCDINHGKCDVVVTDGFTGNVALKTMEGFASFILGSLRDVFESSWRTRLAYLLVRKRFAAMRTKLDPHEYGGAPLLGLSGVSIIAHGSSNAHAIRNAVRTAANEALVSQVNAEIRDLLARVEPAIPAKQSGGGMGIRALFSRMRDRLARHPKDSDPAPPKPPEAQKSQAPRQMPAVPSEKPTEPTEHTIEDAAILSPAENGAHSTPVVSQNGAAATADLHPEPDDTIHSVPDPSSKPHPED